MVWLDGEMHASDAERFEVALGRDEQLAARTEMLRVGQTDIACAFAPLLKEAPQSRLEAQLANVLAQPQATAAKATGVSRRALIAASLSFLVIGSGLGYFARYATGVPGERKNS